MTTGLYLTTFLSTDIIPAGYRLFLERKMRKLTKKLVTPRFLNTYYADSAGSDPIWSSAGPDPI